MPPRKKTADKPAAEPAKTDATVDEAPPTTSRPKTVEITLSAHHGPYIPGDKIEVSVDEAAALRHAGVAGPRDEPAG